MHPTLTTMNSQKTTKALGNSPAEKKVLREYFRRIGAKGGAAGKDTQIRRDISKRAAIIRWRKKHPKPKKVAVAYVA